MTLRDAFGSSGGDWRAGGATFKIFYEGALNDGAFCRQLRKGLDGNSMLLNSSSGDVVVFTELFFKNEKFGNFGENETNKRGPRGRDSSLSHSGASSAPFYTPEKPKKSETAFIFKIKKELILGQEVRDLIEYLPGFVAVVTNDGFLTLFEFQNQNSPDHETNYIVERLNHIDLNLAKKEEVCTLSVAKPPQNNQKLILGVATSTKLKAKNLFLLSMQTPESFNKLFSLSLSGLQIAKNRLSFFQILNMDFWLKPTKLMVLGFQYCSESLAVALIFDTVKEEFEVLSDSQFGLDWVYHSNVACKGCFDAVNGSLWSMDHNGSVKILSLVSGGPGK